MSTRTPFGGRTARLERPAAVRERAEDGSDGIVLGAQARIAGGGELGPLDL